MKHVSKIQAIPRQAFRDYQKQLAYEDAFSRSEELLESTTWEGEAYRKGYDTEEEGRKDSITYPYFVAGRDRRKQGL